MNLPFILLLALPVIGAASVLLVKKSSQALQVTLLAAVLTSLASLYLGALVIRLEVLEGLEGFFRVDSFSVWHLVLLTTAVFLPSTLYAYRYFEKGASIDLSYAKRFGLLWLGALAAMSLALVTGNIGIMWVAIEASTLFTAFLIFRNGNAASVEAMWKYIMMCSVGVALAFIGTLLMAAAGQQAGLEGGENLLIHKIYEVRALLKPNLALTAFIFILIGYGTKAGLAPMHNWLPDAHSQAPGPVSAMFSGFLLNTALYCILRFLPIVADEQVAGVKAQVLLMVFAILSIVIASIFIFFQKDAKRMLAYCSVEHMGIIAFAYSLGPIGAAAGLFHTLNHSLAKTASFFSAASLGKKLHTNALSAFTGALRQYPLYALGFAGSMLALIGVAPFSIFISEFMLVSAAAEASQYLALGLFLAATSVVFLVMLKHSIAIVWGKSQAVETQHRITLKSAGIESLIILLPLLILAVLGIWKPLYLSRFMEMASSALWSMK